MTGAPAGSALVGVQQAAEVALEGILETLAEESEHADDGDDPRQDGQPDGASEPAHDHGQDGIDNANHGDCRMDVEGELAFGVLGGHYLSGGAVGVLHARARVLGSSSPSVFLGLRNTAHRAGERVRALTAEKPMAIAMVRPNWR